MLNSNQTTTLIVILILFVGAGGLQQGGENLVKCAIGCSITGTIVVEIAEFLHNKIL